jgi:hypothetical protein
MTRFPRLFLVALAVLAVGLACLPAEAGQPGGRAGGRAGGFGGMGMMGGIGGLNLVMVASNEQVQAKLELTDAQKEAIAEIAKGARGGGRGARLGPDATAEERAAARAERAKAQAATEEKIKAAVGDKAAKLVLIAAGVALQAGPRALADEGVAKAVGVAEASQKKVLEIVQASLKKNMAVFQELRDSGADQEAIQAKMKELQTALNAEISEVLTAKEKESVKAAVDAAADIKIAPRGGRGGRGGGRAGGAAPPATTQ